MLDNVSEVRARNLSAKFQIEKVCHTVLWSIGGAVLWSIGGVL